MKETEKIASRENQKLKLVRAVRDGKFADLIFIEGARLVEEALRSNLSVEQCFVSTGFAKSERRRDLLGELTEREVPLFEVSDSIFQTIADTNSAQGVLLIAKRPEKAKSSIENRLRVNGGGPAIVIFLYQVNDPSNVGAVMRTAEAAGVAGVIISKDSADAFSPKALRSAMGAAFRVSIWADADLEEVLSWSRENGLRTTAADVNAKAAYSDIDWKIPRLLAFGSEAHGLHEDVRATIDDLTFIPMENGVESLNLAVAGGVILFEAKRQNSNA